MGIAWEKVTLDMIGAGGVAGEPTLVEEINTAIHAIAAKLQNPRVDGKGKITIVITMDKIGEDGAVAIIPDLKITEPPLSRRGLAAMMGDGELLAQEHKQMPLMGGADVLDLARKENGGR